MMDEVFDPPAGEPSPLPAALAPRAFWVSEPHLLAGAYPGDTDAAARARKVAALLALGVTDVVSLMEADEVDHWGRAFHPYAPALASKGVRVRRFPIRDVTAPSSALVTAIIDHIDGVLSAGGTAYVHCWGGRGRTGVIIGCWMVRHGWLAPENAVAKLARLRARCVDAHVRAPDTAAQVARVRGWRVRQ